MVMSGTLKALVAKIKQRRRARLWRRRRAEQMLREEAKDDTTGLTEQMAGLQIGLEKVVASSFIDQNGPTPHVFGNIDFKFDFELATEQHDWPGPKYDQMSQFAPGIFDRPRHPKRRPRPKSFKRRLSHDERPAVRKPEQRPTSPALKAIARTKRANSSPQFHGSPPPRDVPLHLLNLPGEIRNEVYRILCISADPISAHFRAIVNPKRGLKKGAYTRHRFPREPGLALVCRQLHQEALSVFYGENKFVFQRNENLRSIVISKALRIMTRNENMLLWVPRFGFADSLRHVELHFRAREPTFKTFGIKYTFTRTVNGKVTISSSAESSDSCIYCMCSERKALQQLRPTLSDEIYPRHLVELAANFSMKRRDIFRQDMSLSADFPYIMYRPTEGTCNDCGLERLREIWSGL